MKYAAILALFLGASNAISIRHLKQVDPVENHCTNANKATGVDQTCSTPGNSAWNTLTSSRTGNPHDALSPPYPGHKLHLQMSADGVDPVENHCTNANKATGVDQTCSTPGNSAWNTLTSSRTGNPHDALSPPYPGHKLHVQLDSEVDPVENHCTNPNKATGVDQTCSTPGNSAWNTLTSARTANPHDALSPPYPGHKLHVQLDSEVDPVENHCTNPNKATGVDQTCSTPGNSAWNTLTSARTGNPHKALDAPYPGHKLH